MNQIDPIQASDIGALLRGRMGLILGPDLTCGPNHFADLSSHISAAFGLHPADFLVAAESALDDGATEERVKESLNEFIHKTPRQPQTQTIGSGKWSAVLSLTFDSYFENALRQETDKHPLRKQLFQVTDLTMACPQRTIPVFKLLGRSDQDDCAFCTTRYLMRKGAWRHAIRQFADLVRGNPVFCLGVDGALPLFHDLLAEMIAEPIAIPRQLIMMADSGITNDPSIKRLLTKRTRALSFSGGLNQLVAALNTVDRAGYAPTLGFDTEESAPFAPLNPYRDLVTVVNAHEQSSISAPESVRLHDLLFSPEIPAWDPFAHNLDFRRTISAELLAQLNGRLPQKSLREGACILHGSAASGKTTTLKRLAYDLAKSGHFVLWFGTWFFAESGRALYEVLKAAAKLPFAKKKRLVCFVDDPFRMGAVSPRELVGAARSLSIDLILVVGTRTADLRTSQADEVTGGLPLMFDSEMSDALDDDEWDRLPEYLVTLGIAETLDGARSQVTSTPARTTRDILSLLYWLLPATKAAIASSIKEEYFRLGDLGGFKRVIIGADRLSAELLQRAYEMTAVADRYRAQLPVEVLVSALGVDYASWLEASAGGSSAFGLLYSYPSEDGGACYRTRNDVVTQAIIDIINGGRLSRTGELTVLSKVIGACTGATAVYHEFCTSVLVASDRFQELRCDEGRALFDCALAALPFKCRTILHHKARWAKNKCNDPLEAEKLLDIALETRNYPYARQPELDEHIHTTAAANMITQIDQGIVSLDDGKVKVQQHLAKANASKLFLARAVHVEANLILRLAPRLAQADSPDTAILLNDVLANIDRTLLVLRNPNAPLGRSAGDVHMLEDVRGNLFLAVQMTEEWEGRAEQLWQKYKSQQGFILWGRKLFESAEERKKGSDYYRVFEYLDGVIKRVREAQVEPEPMLFELLVHVYYKWRVQRAAFSSGDVAIDWTLLKESCRGALQSAHIAANPFYTYIYAVARAHLGEWAKAHTLLVQLRQSGLGNDVLWLARDFLLEENGKARLVQGVIREGAHRTFFADELQTDFFCDRMSQWNLVGEQDYAYIQFAFGGIRAVDRFTIGALQS